MTRFPLELLIEPKKRDDLDLEMVVQDVEAKNALLSLVAAAGAAVGADREARIDAELAEGAR